MRASMSAASFLLASTGPFFWRIRSPVGSPPGSQAVAPSQVDGTSSCNGSRSPSSGLLCGGASASCLRFCGGASRLRRHSGGSASGGGLCVRLPFRAAPLVCAGPHEVASRLHVRARLCLVPRVSALRAWPRWLSQSCQRVRLWGYSRPVDAATTTGGAPPRSCALTLEGSTSPMPAFSLTAASPTESGAPGLPRRIGESFGADALPDFSRPSICESGGFKHSGRRSVPRHSEAAPSPREAVRWRKGRK